ncbi:MAG: tyrosine-type recombinase/integrase [Candidatus Bathyarchaeia archaeon]
MGVRVGELLWVKLKNVEFDQYGATMTVHGKTGSRRVRLVSSVPALSNWIQHHPNKGEPESPLWVSIGSTNNGKQLKYQSLVTRIKKIARKAGIKKRVNPHTFRHSRATDLAKVLTEAQMKEYFGWTQSSDMASVYVHLFGRDTDHAILRIHGLLTKDEQIKTEQRKTKKCVYCKHENTPESEACVNCGKPLDIENAIQQEKHEKEFLRMLTPEIIETMIQKKVEEILSERGILCNSKPSKS